MERSGLKYHSSRGNSGGNSGGGVREKERMGRSQLPPGLTTVASAQKQSNREEGEGGASVGTDSRAPYFGENEEREREQRQKRKKRRGNNLGGERRRGRGEAKITVRGVCTVTGPLGGLNSQKG